MPADLDQALHAACPFRLDIIGVIVGGGGDRLDRLIAGHGLVRDALGAVPGFLALDLVCEPVTGKGELAGIAAVGALINDAADRLGIVGILGAVENDLGDGELAKFGFGARFKIDGAGEAILLRRVSRVFAAIAFFFSCRFIL